MKQETKVKIEIYYTTKRMKTMSDIMRYLDLGIENIALSPIVATYTTISKVDKKYREKLLKTYKKAFVKDDIIIKDIKLEVIKKLI